MSNPDRRHAIQVTRRFESRLGASYAESPVADRRVLAAGLMHDVGKIRCGLGTCARVVATLVGPRCKRFRLYHDHETIGVEMLLDIGSDPLTISLVGRQPSAPPAVADALAWADEI